jgi:1-acyl-sn-glycerol-3-phosphate acyltransferase
MATFRLPGVKDVRAGRVSEIEGGTVHRLLESYRPDEAAAPRVGLNPTATVLSWAAKLLAGSSIRWVDCQPDTCQRIYFANHTSHLDAVVLWASLPRAVRALTRPVAARDYWERDFFRRYVAGCLNALLIDRENIKVHQSPVEMMMRAIGQTYSLIVFPEGGRNVDEEMGEFKSGLYYLSKKRPDLELVPVYIDNLNRVLPRGEFLPVPMLSCITVGPPIWLETGESKVEFLKRARESVRRLKDV